MTDLAEFLLARIAEDEAFARAAGSGPWCWEQGYGDMCNDSDCPYGQLMQDKPEGLTMLMEVHGYDVRDDEWDGSKHIARHDPARVLAECEAKRRIANVYRALAVDAPAREVGSPRWHEVKAYETVLQTLAVPYADHPEYREEWRL